MLQIPQPANWQDFEALCRDLWSRIWDDDNAQRHGREGQPQHGVDIFGRPGRGATWAGVQCKLKSQHLGGRLGAAEIEAEVAKARSFNPRLTAYILATTAPRDVAVQQTAREITERHASSDEFSVTVFAWEDICERLEAHEDLLAQHFPHLGFAGGSARATRRNYLERLWERLYPVPLLGIGRGTSRGEDVPLAKVYTALDVTAEVRIKQPGGIAKRRAHGPQGVRDASLLWGAGGYLIRLEARLRQEAATREESRREKTYGRQWTALEAAAAIERLVLLGQAGSGKSTFASYLALCLAGRALGFLDASLAPFDAEKARGFIAGWYAHLARRKQIAAEQAQRQGAALWREIESSPHLRPLAERPLLLTMMADLHAASGGRLPGGRAGLYERSVELLLDRWNQVRDVLGGESLSEHLGITAQQVRQALEGLAYKVHGESGGGGERAAEIGAAELWQALDAGRPRPLEEKVDERQVMDYLRRPPTRATRRTPEAPASSG